MPVALPAEFRAQALTLAAKIGADAAAESLTRAGSPVTSRAIRKWQAAQEAARNGVGRPSASTPARRPSPPPSAPVASSPRPSSTTPAPPSPSPARDLPPELDGVDPEALDFAALEELSRDIVAYRRAAKDEDNIRAFAALARLEMEVRVAMNKVRPPARVDPDTDPANIEAAELLLERLGVLVSAAEGGAPAAPGRAA